MPKTHVAPLAQRPAHPPSAMVVVNYQRTGIAANNTFRRPPSGLDHHLLVRPNSGHFTMQFSVRPAAWAAPAIKT